MFINFVLIVALSGIQLSTAEFYPVMTKRLPRTMKAVVLQKYLPISDPSSLIDMEVNVPELEDSQVLIEVRAISVNPIDTKIRAPKGEALNATRILGWDGSGVVALKGSHARTFNVGDEVFFTGDLRKNGSNAEYVAIDEIMVGAKPKNLNFEEAAAMPLTSVTAYEALFDRMLLSAKDKGKSLLIINSAGGVGAASIQLAKNVGLYVIGTASRPESEAFSRRMGADLVLNHKEDLYAQLKVSGFSKGVDYIMVNFDPYPYWDLLMKIIKPQGTICLVVDCSRPVDIRLLKDKSVTLVSEMMGTRIRYDTEDKDRHHEILQEISKLLEYKKMKTTLTKVIAPINAANLRDAHRLIEERRMIGKLVLSGF
ncbi:zinc-type alcohol dehydrogenase-like protein SERP1785 [Pectinophora gossypiella]|uniref:zinc-type alcohol dehydrogenase-like protein SERP1785 n=1 Tax=Pectinophora gossypiella TaxID=13191 RepID=UPI00214F22F6|nr:zinc-type alcohol dehydrogenase-like protein SERP1785 [Pectinophora gossypiella]